MDDRSRGGLVLAALDLYGGAGQSTADIAYRLGWTERYTRAVLACLVHTGEVRRYRSGYDQRVVYYARMPLIKSVHVAGQVEGA